MFHKTAMVKQVGKNGDIWTQFLMHEALEEKLCDKHIHHILKVNQSPSGILREN